MIFIKEHILATQHLHDHIVLHLSPFPATSKLPIQIKRTDEDGIDTVRVYLRTSSNHFFNRVLVYGSLLLALLQILVGGFYPDIVHLHIFAEVRFMLFIARLFQIPTVITEHWSALSRPTALSPHRLAKAKTIYETCNIVLPVSDYLRECIERNTGASFTYRVIFNAVNEQVFYFEGSTNVSGNTKRQTKRLLTIARTEEPKDFPTLFKAVRQLVDAGYDITLDIVGDGNKRADFEQLAQAILIGHVVTFHGSQPKDIVASMMRKSDLFVLSSKWENSPCVIGEALCCGLPVVASAVGGIPELLQPGDGLTVPAEDPTSLAQAIQEVLARDNSIDGASISERAHSRFGYQSIGRQLDQVYRDVHLNGLKR